MEFQLKSQFEPTGDQPQAIEQLTTSVRSSKAHQTLLGVTGSGKTFTLAHVIQNIQKPTLVISHNKTLAAQLYQEFRDFFPNNAVSYFVSYYDYYQPEAYLPSTDTYIEKEVDINDEIDKLRLSSTANLLSRKDCIVVASVSCIYNLGSPLEYAKNLIELVPGQILPQTTFIKRLVDIQYNRSDYELNRGNFQLKGDTLLIWPGDKDYALRFSLLEDTIESIIPIDPISKIPLNPNPVKNNFGIEKYIIYPAKHYLTRVQDQDQALNQIKRDLAARINQLKSSGKIVEAYRLGQKVKHDIEMIRELGYVNGIENYSLYFDQRQSGEPPSSLLDYFAFNAQQYKSDGFLTLIDESHITIPQLRGMYAGDQSRKSTLIEYGFRLPSALDNRPLRFPETLDRLPQIIYSSATPNDWELEKSGQAVAQQLIRPTGLVDPLIEIRSTKNQITDLIHEIILRVQKGQRTLVTTLTKKTAEALTEYLNDPQKITQLISNSSSLKESNPKFPKVQYLHADVNTLDRSDILDSLRAGEFDVVVGINLLREGLDLPEVSLVAILEADKEGFLRSKTSLIQTMGRAARHQDGFVIMYADSTTKSMSAAIMEVDRRRQLQLRYNRQHHIKPKSIQKPLRSKLLNRELKDQLSVSLEDLSFYGWQSIEEIDPTSLTPKDKRKLIISLTTKMNLAAKDWDFEAAANLRDAIKKIDPDQKLSSF